MEPRQGSWEALIVARQAAETTDPSETALNHPPVRKEHQAVAALGALDHDQAHALLLRRGRRHLARVRGTRCANALISRRSASLAGVTATAKSVPIVSTTAWTLEPRTR